MADPIPNPTNEPVLPPAVAKWVWLAYTALSLVVLPALLIAFPEDSKPALLATAVITGLGALLRTLTTNSFGGAAKLLVIGLVGASLVTLPACQMFKPAIKTDLRACAADAVGAEVAALMPDVLKAIQGDTAQWERQLDTLVANAGQAALCAIVAVVRNLELGSGGAGAGVVGPELGGLDTTTLRVRGYVFLAKHNL